jgi:hypothetical protein
LAAERALFQSKAKENPGSYYLYPDRFARKEKKCLEVV